MFRRMREVTLYVGPFRIIGKTQWDELLQDQIRFRRMAMAALELLTPEQREQVDERVAELEASDNADPDRPFGGRVL